MFDIQEACQSSRPATCKIHDSCELSANEIQIVRRNNLYFICSFKQKECQKNCGKHRLWYVQANELPYLYLNLFSRLVMIENFKTYGLMISSWALSWLKGKNNAACCQVQIVCSLWQLKKIFLLLFQSISSAISKVNLSAISNTLFLPFQNI